MELNKDYEDYEQFDKDQEKEINEKTRINFMRKVYGILFIQLILTTIFILIPQYPTIKNQLIKFHREHYYQMFIISLLSGILSIISFIFLFINSKKVPLNYFLLFLFTFFESISLIFITYEYQFESIILAFTITAGCTFGLTIYALTTKTNFTIFGGLVFSLFFMFFFGTLMFCLIGFNIDNTIFNVIGGIFASFYIIYDTQLICGKFGNKFSIDDYMIAAISVYIDVINLFIYILRIIGKKSNEKK